LLAIDSPILLVAHSLGVSLVLHWAASAPPDDRVKGALLVAPADVDSPEHTPEVTRNFALMPVQKMPFPSIVAASENDPYVSFTRAAYFARAWGSELVNVGRKGHINGQSNVGPWKE
jgi:predicted alpha/beta hydrolase family esterase